MATSLALHLLFLINLFDQQVIVLCDFNIQKLLITTVCVHRITIMLGVGRNLQTPCLQPDQLLNGSRISRLFAQKNIWLKPVENIQDIDQCLITDMLPVSTLPYE